MKIPFLYWMLEVTIVDCAWDNRSAVETPEILLIFKTMQLVLPQEDIQGFWNLKVIYLKMSSWKVCNLCMSSWSGTETENEWNALQ